MGDSAFPNALDAFMPPIDGVHPISTDEFHTLMVAIERIQTAMGYGPQSAVSSVYGPKGGAASVKARLDALFAADGSGLDDFVFLTGTYPANLFSESGQGCRIAFGKQMSGSDYVVMFGSGILGEDDGLLSDTALGSWVVGNASNVDSVVIAARFANGAPIFFDTTTPIHWGLLVFGPKAWY